MKNMDEEEELAVEIGFIICLKHADNTSIGDRGNGWLSSKQDHLTGRVKIGTLVGG